MPISDYPKIQNLINGGYEFKFSKYLDDGWNLFQKTPFLFVGGLLALLLFCSALVFIPVIGILSLPFISTILSLGFYVIAHKNATNQDAKFNDFLGGFQFTKDVVLRVIVYLFIVGFCYGVYVYAIWDTGYIQWNMEAAQYFGDMEALAAMGQPPYLPFYYNLLLIPFYYFTISYSWSDLFIMYKGMNFWDAMEASRRLISKNWFRMLGLIIVLTLMFFVGALLCGVGLFLAIPLYTTVLYASFADVVGLYDSDDLSHEILDDLVGD